MIAKESYLFVPKTYIKKLYYWWIVQIDAVVNLIRDLYRIGVFVARFVSSSRFFVYNVYHPQMQIFMYECQLKSYLALTPDISMKIKLGVVTTIDKQYWLSVFWEERLYMTWLPLNLFWHGLLTLLALLR